MTKNPFLNALSATVYIVLVATLMTWVTNTQDSKPDTFLDPILAMSLLTLSAAIMAYLFLYQPLQLFIEGHKKQAVNLFLQTVGVFAVITVLAFVLLFSGLIK